MTTTDTLTAADAPHPANALTADAIALGAPLEWPLVDRDGTPLLESGALVADAHERRFLFDHFSPRRGDLGPVESGAESSAEAAPAHAVPRVPACAQDMHLSIGSQMGLRAVTAGATPMRRCRLIGVAPNGSLFVTPPQADSRLAALMIGENVDIVAISSQMVFRFVCSIDAICQQPFDYLVLSKPGGIRQLRKRSSIRVRTHFAVQYGIGETGDGYDGVGVAKTVGAYGISLVAARALGTVGERLRVAFRLRTDELDMRIETTAVIRNVARDGQSEHDIAHGIELDCLTSAEQMAMKVFVFDRQEDLEH